MRQYNYYKIIVQLVDLEYLLLLLKIVTDNFPRIIYSRSTRHPPS